MTALLEAKGLCKRYAGFALRDVSFALRPGSIMGLIGKKRRGQEHHAQGRFKHGAARRRQRLHAGRGFFRQ